MRDSMRVSWNSSERTVLVAIFGKKDTGPKQQQIRSGQCIYLGEPYPLASEMIQISVFEVVFLYSKGELPGSWTAICRDIRERTGEPDERRVFVNILGTMLAMVSAKINQSVQIGGLDERALRITEMMNEGVDNIAEYRNVMAACSPTSDFFDFEVTKIASMLAIPRSRESREEGGWCVPDIWPGDLSIFSF